MIPSSYVIDPAQKLVVTISRGTLTTAHYWKHLTALAADPAFDPAFAFLYDLRNATQILCTSDEIRAMGRRPLFLPTSLRAVVASTDFMFGMARMYERSFDLGGGANSVYNVFRQMDQAETWLSIDYARAIQGVIVHVPADDPSTAP